MKVLLASVYCCIWHETCHSADFLLGSNVSVRRTYVGSTATPVQYNSLRRVPRTARHSQTSYVSARYNGLLPIGTTTIGCAADVVWESRRVEHVRV